MQFPPIREAETCESFASALFPRIFPPTFRFTCESVFPLYRSDDNCPSGPTLRINRRSAKRNPRIKAPTIVKSSAGVCQIHPREEGRKQTFADADARALYSQQRKSLGNNDVWVEISTRSSQTERVHTVHSFLTNAEGEVQRGEEWRRQGVGGGGAGVGEEEEERRERKKGTESSGMK